MNQVSYAIDIDVYGVQIGVFEDQADLLTWYHERGLDTAAVTQAGSTAYSGFVDGPDNTTWLVAWIPRGASPTTIAHEAVHLAAFTLESASVPFDSDHHEALAYLVGFIAGKITEEQ